MEVELLGIGDFTPHAEAPGKKGSQKHNCEEEIMGCKTKKENQRRKSCKRPIRTNDGQLPAERVTIPLKNTGREQFFWHFPKSKLPIRDVLQKTEPHLEIGAENYLRRCIQPNIRGFLKKPERYLFLCTTCKNHEVGNGEFFGKRFVVGCIEKKHRKVMGDDHLAVIGTPYMVPFDKKLEYCTLGFTRGRFMQCFDEKDTEKLLRLIHRQNDITNKFMEEMIEKEAEARNKGIGIPRIDKECLDLKNRCEFRNSCLRRRLYK